MSVLDRILAWDRATSARLAIRRAGLLRLALQILAHTGDGIVCLAAGAGLLLTGRQDLALREEVTVISMMVIVAILKTLFRRRRPAGERGALYFGLDAHSFPSGHAARAAGLAVTLGALSGEVAIGLGIWAVLVSLSRVALEVHYLSDVAAGGMVGIGGGAVILLLLTQAA